MADVTVTKTIVSALNTPPGTYRPGAAGGTIEAGDVVYIDGNNGGKRASAAAAGTAGAAGVLIAPQDVISGDEGLDLSGPGCLIGGFSGLTPGNLLYLSNTAGKLSTTPGTVTKVCARVIKSDQILWTLEGGSV